MGGQLKGRVALAGLLLVVVVFGVALAVTPAARVRYWAWRARSSDRGVRLAARIRLMEIGRPAIDAVFPELVAGEAGDRLAEVPVSQRVVLVGRFEETPMQPIRGGPFVDWPFDVDPALAQGGHTVVRVRLEAAVFDPLARSFVKETSRPHRTLVAGSEAHKEDAVVKLFMVWLEEDDPLAAAVIEETKARLDLGR